MSRASYARVQATVGVGTVLIWDFGVAYARGGAGYEEDKRTATVRKPSTPCSPCLAVPYVCYPRRHITHGATGTHCVFPIVPPYSAIQSSAFCASCTHREAYGRDSFPLQNLVSDSKLTLMTCRIRSHSQRSSWNWTALILDPEKPSRVQYSDQATAAHIGVPPPPPPKKKQTVVYHENRTTVDTVKAGRKKTTG